MLRSIKELNSNNLLSIQYDNIIFKNISDMNREMNHHIKKYENGKNKTLSLVKRDEKLKRRS